MTEPQPAHENAGAALSSHDPWSPPRADHGRTPDPEVPGRRQEFVQSVLALLGTALLGGGAVGLLWVWLAPRVPLFRNGEALYPVNSEGEQVIAADGTFLFLSLGVGLLLGAAAFLLWRHGGVPLVLGLAVGAALGALLAWRLGVWLEPTRAEVLARGRELEPGGRIDAPLELHAKVALLGLPFGALAGHAASLSIWGPRDPEPPRPRTFPQWHR